MDQIDFSIGRVVTDVFNLLWHLPECALRTSNIHKVHPKHVISLHFMKCIVGKNHKNVSQTKCNLKKKKFEKSNCPKIQFWQNHNIFRVEVKHRPTDCTDYTDWGFFFKLQVISLCFTIYENTDSNVTKHRLEG